MNATSSIHEEFAPIALDGLPTARFIPLDRYRAITSHLDGAVSNALELSWLRFAAQEVVLCPDEPAAVAQQIRDLASQLQRESMWSRDFASPMRFIVAGLMVRQNVPIADFLARHMQTISLLREVGLRAGGFYETVAVLIIHMTPKAKSFDLEDARRVKSLYEQMKKCHWWLTGANDLPDCAALAECNHSPEVTIARAESAYQQLRAAGIASGRHLQTAANIMPLSDLPIRQVVERWLALKAYWENYGPIDPFHFGALAVLTALDHSPDWVIRKVMTVSDELDLLQPQLAGYANVNIAANLTVLDLMRYDASHEPLQGAGAIDAMLRQLHTYHLASAVVVSQVRDDLIPEAVGYRALGLF
jgi:hypothetical protein